MDSRDPRVLGLTHDKPQPGVSSEGELGGIRERGLCEKGRFAEAEMGPEHASTPPPRTHIPVHTHSDYHVNAASVIVGCVRREMEHLHPGDGWIVGDVNMEGGYRGWVSRFCSPL